MNRTQLIVDWITGLGWDATQETGYPLFPGQDYVSITTPDRAVFITLATGPGYVTEEMSAEQWGFQARVRGPADDQADAEHAMFQLDALITTAGLSATTVDGANLQHVGRLAGAPDALPLDPSDRRFQWTCQYLAVTGPIAYAGV